MDSLLSLTYLNIRGLAEPINLMLVDVSINYRDERLRLDQWNARRAEGTYGPVYGQPFHDLPILSVKTAIGTVILAGIYTILEYLEDAFDIHAGKDILYKAKINMVRDASMSFIQKFHNYLNSETWDCSEERARFRELHVLPFLLDVSRHIGVNGVQGEFGADLHQPLTAAGACIFEALELVELFFPTALNDWPILAILRGRISIRPNIRDYLQGGKRQQKISTSPHETPERVAYLSLKTVPSQQQSPRKSDASRVPSIHSNADKAMSMSGVSPRNTLKKKHPPSSPSSASVNLSRRSIGSKMESGESETHLGTLSSPKNDDTASKYSMDVSPEGKRQRVYSFSRLFVKKRSSKIKLQTPDNPEFVMVDDKKRNSYKPADVDNRSMRSIRQTALDDGSLSVHNTVLNPPFFNIFPETLKFPASDGDNNVRSSIQSDSLYSSGSGPEYSTVLAI